MKQRDVLILIIPACMLVFAWIVFSVHHNFITSTIPETINVQITPITASFDTQVIAELKKRKKTFPAYRIVITPTPTTNQAPSSQISSNTTPSPAPTISPKIEPSISEALKNSSEEGAISPP